MSVETLTLVLHVDREAGTLRVDFGAGPVDADLPSAHAKLHAFAMSLLRFLALQELRETIATPEVRDA